MKRRKRVYQEAYGSARFAAPTLDPLQVTKALRLPADFQNRPGEPRFRRTRKGRVIQQGSIPFGCGRCPQRNGSTRRRLETHLKWLLQELEPRAESIQLLRMRIPELQTDLFCFSRGTTPHLPSLPRALVAERAEQLGFPVGIDHYDSTDWKS